MTRTSQVGVRSLLSPRRYYCRWIVSTSAGGKCPRKAPFPWILHITPTRVRRTHLAQALFKPPHHPGHGLRILSRCHDLNRAGTSARAQRFECDPTTVRCCIWLCPKCVWSPNRTWAKQYATANQDKKSVPHPTLHLHTVLLASTLKLLYLVCSIQRSPAELSP